MKFDQNWTKLKLELFFIDRAHSHTLTHSYTLTHTHAHSHTHMKSFMFTHTTSHKNSENLVFLAIQIFVVFCHGHVEFTCFHRFFQLFNIRLRYLPEYITYRTRPRKRVILIGTHTNTHISNVPCPALRCLPSFFFFSNGF